MVVRRKRRPPFEVLAMPALGALVFAAHGDAFAAPSKDLGHAWLVPKSAGEDSSGEERRTVKIRMLFAAALVAGLLTTCPVSAVAQTTPTVDQARALFARHDYKGALAILNRVLQIDPKNSRALVMRGDAKDLLGQSQDALTDYNAAIQINPDYAYAYATRCDTKVRLDRYDDAVADCTKSISLDPNDGFPYRYRSAAYYFLHNYTAAETDAEKSKSLDPSNPYTLLAMCRAKFGVQKYNEARDACTNGIALDSKSENMYFYRGRSALAQQLYDAAAADLRKALDLAPDFGSARYWLAVSEFKGGSYDSALFDTDAYLLGDPSDADSLLLRARIDRKRGNAAAASRDAREALRQYRIQNDAEGMKSAQAFIDELSNPRP